MNQIAFVSLASVAALGAGLLATGTLRADPPLRGPVVGPAGPALSELKGPSGPLSAVKKLEAVNRTLKGLGIGAMQALNVPAQMKVTPAAPVQSGGAKIGYATPITFAAPTAALPDGIFMLNHSAQSPSVLRVDFPTESGKLYLVDCKLTALWGATPLTFSVKRGDAAQTIGVEDGHMLYTFQSSGGSQAVQLTPSQSAVFYGCEITKIN